MPQKPSQYLRQEQNRDKYTDQHTHPQQTDEQPHAANALTLAIALATACGSSWGEGGDPAEIVADIAHELEIYDIGAYLAQDIPDDQRARFEDVQAQFARYGIDFADVNTFAKAIVGCCDYNSTTLLQGTRLYVLDGNIDLDLLRSKLEEELFESSEASGYETLGEQGAARRFPASQPGSGRDHYRQGLRRYGRH